MNQEILKTLAAVRSKRIEKTGLVPAAVLVPLLKDRNEQHILFIRRSNSVKDHKGEISFPGGVVESGDPALLDTALRECNEEIGLAPADVTVLGQLDDIETASTGYLISPFVGLIPYPYAFQVNADEIEALIIVPLEALLKPSTSRRHTGNNEDPQIPAPIFRYEDHIIWGATARILLQLVDLIAHSTSAHLTSNAT